MILQQLANASGPSGREEAVRQVVIEAIRDHVDSYQVDGLGNCIALKRGAAPAADGRSRRVMVSAHMDEVALMIVQITGEGLLRFRKIGGIDDRVLPSKRVLVGEKRVPGVIGCKPLHLLHDAEFGQVAASDDLYIDIGASSAAAAERLVQRGDYAVFDTPYEPWPQARLVKGKAFDDRAGCAVLVELLRGDPYPFDLYGVFTVQEEVGLRGARVAAYAVDPDAAIALEGTICDDMPKKKDISSTTVLGQGPSITIMDRSMIADRRLVQLLIDTAQAEGIPYQFKQPLMGSTDSGTIHLAREGVPTTVVSIPSRYIHSPVTLLSLDDLENTVKLMRAALIKLADLEL